MWRDVAPAFSENSLLKDDERLSANGRHLARGRPPLQPQWLSQYSALHRRSCLRRAASAAMHSFSDSRPASASVLLLTETAVPETPVRRPSAALPLPAPPHPPSPLAAPALTASSSPAIRRPSAVVPVNPAQMVASQQRFVLGLMQERCSALRASLSGLSGRRPSGAGGTLPETHTKRESGRKRRSLSCQMRNDAFTAMLSALYAKTLVVLGIAFPITEILSDIVPPGFYQGYYLFLYVGSMGFMFFMYAALLKDRAVTNIIRMHSEYPSDASEKSFRPEEPMFRRNSLTPVVRYGSFYLRLGAVAFGIGSMVHSGLEFGEFFELKGDPHCYNVLQALNPAARMLFTLLQMQFIFLNSKDMKMWRHKVVARFGLMHVIACNLCEWLYVLVQETRHEIAHLQGHGNGTHEPDPHKHDDRNGTRVTRGADASYLDECRISNIIEGLVRDASPFLFPCTIEYSLICAVVLYEMWKNVHKPAASTNSAAATAVSTPAASAAPTRPASALPGDDSNDSKEEQCTDTRILPLDHNQHPFVYPPPHMVIHHRSDHQFSVDCAGAHKGLFMGILVLVLTIISLILFFVLSKDGKHRQTAVLEVNVTELVLYSLCITAVLWCMVTIRELKYHRKQSHNGSQKHSLSLDTSLLLIAQTGMFIYCMFSIIGCYFTPGTELGLIAELFSLVQTTVQTVFVLDAWSRRCRSSSQCRRKPGRQLVTFLLVANMSMWSINTLEKGHASFRPTHLLFYGEWAWTIITHVSMPLAIFYRFHSTICLFEIWKNAYKLKHPY